MTNWLSRNEGRCPRCDEYKFIGHGPLCSDCYLETEDES